MNKHGLIINSLLIMTLLTTNVTGYDEVGETYYPLLTPPAHIYKVATWDSGQGDKISGLSSGIGDVSPADTFQCDLYIVSSGEPTTSTEIRLDFYKDPFYSGYARYDLDLGGRPTGQWIHINVPMSSIPAYDGMDWASGGIFQLRGLAGSFDVWIDNLGFYNGSSPVTILIDGANDTWGHNFTTAPTHGTPPVDIVPSAGYATHFVYSAGSGQFGNLASHGAYKYTMIMLESLQGLLLKSGNSEGVFLEASSDYRNTFELISDRRTVTSEYVVSPKTPWWLVDHFSSDFSGQYILYDAGANPDSINAARMAAYTHNAVMVDKAIEYSAISNGLTLALDVSSYDDQWIYENWWSTWHRKDLAIDQVAGVNLNDYATAVGPVAFREEGSALRFAFLSEMDEDSTVLGWPDESYGEPWYTRHCSENSSFVTAAASNLNNALYSAFRDDSKLPLQQKSHASIVAEEDTHYVTFAWSDGDNVSWHSVSYCWNERWWASPDRGKVPIGWTVNPSVRDLNQMTLEYRYETASDTPGAEDCFIASGPIGYGYPSMFSASARASNAERVNDYMGDLDISVLMILDKDAFETPNVYMPYLEQSNIDSIFYLDVWGNYAKYNGDIKWVNDKPIISLRMHMYDSDAIQRINASPKDPTSEDGYSMVYVGAWTQTVSDIVAFTEQLDPSVKVVTPEQFVQLITDNVTRPSPTSETSIMEIDMGDRQYADYGTPSSQAFLITTDSAEQMADQTTSTKFQIASEFAFSNMDFSPVNVAEEADTFSFDIYGDGSGSLIRLELFSSAAGFIYKDLFLDFSGWRSFSFALDGSDGLLVWGAEFSEVLSSLNIWQVSGSWNSIPATFYLDNVSINKNEESKVSSAFIMY